MARGGLRSTSFKPGQVNNPKGRPKMPVELKEAARAYTTEALQTLAVIMRDKKAPASARAMAAGTLIDRGHGKATQHIEAHVDLIDRLSLTEQEALASALSALAAEQGDAAEGTTETHH